MSGSSAFPRMAILGNAEEPDIPAAAGEIGAFYFLPDAWGTGLAQEAMTYCLSRFQERGSTRVILWVLAENRRARRFSASTQRITRVLPRS